MNQPLFISALVISGWMLSVCLHEFAHAIVAYIGGDKGVKERGYLRFNPFAYIDFKMSILLPTVFILLGGIGLPGAAVLVNDSRLRSRAWSSLVSAAGPIATFLFIVGLILFMHLEPTLDQNLLAGAAWLLEIEIVVFILNMLPVPGLDGFGIIEPFLSQSIREKLRPLSRYGIFILFALLWISPEPNHTLWKTARQVMTAAGVDWDLATTGHMLFRVGSPPLAISCLAVAAVGYFIRKRLNWAVRGDTLMQEKKYSDCAALMATVLAKEDSPKAWRMMALAQLHLALGEDEKAHSSENRRRCQESIDKSVSLQPDHYETWSYKGYIHECLNQPNDAIAAYRKCISIESGCSTAFEGLCRLLLNGNRLDELLSICNNADASNYGEAVFYRGALLSKRQKFQESVFCFDKAIKLGVRPELSRFNRSLALGCLGDIDEARQAIKSAVKLGYSPQYQAEFLLSLKLYDDTILLCDEHLTVTADDGALITAKAHALFQLGKVEECIVQESRAIELGYEVPLNLYNLACSFARLNRLDEAFDALAKAFESHPTSLIELAQTDEDLTNLRSDSRFSELMQKVLRDSQK